MTDILLTACKNARLHDHKIRKVLTRNSVTLINGHVRIVQASILGSILVNLLPILGSALIAAHATAGDDSLASTETQMLACLLFVSVFIFMIPVSLLPSTVHTTPDTYKNPPLDRIPLGV